MMKKETITLGVGRFFSPDAMIWQVDREMVLLLAGGRALLMQLAHPKVAAGVAEHSYFKADPLGRLYRTMSAMWSIVFDETMAAYDLFVKPLAPDEKARYYDDSKKLAQLFEIPETLVPPSLAVFNKYMKSIMAGNEIAVGPIACALAEEILYPRPWILRPAGPLFRLITAGLLPERLREGYRIGWDKRKEKAFRLLVNGIRHLRPLVPSPLRVVPNARAA